VFPGPGPRCRTPSCGGVEWPSVQPLRAPPQPGDPAAHPRSCWALLPSGPDAVRRLTLHRFRAAVRPAVCRAHGVRQCRRDECPVYRAELQRGKMLDAAPC